LDDVKSSFCPSLKEASVLFLVQNKWEQSWLFFAKIKAIFMDSVTLSDFITQRRHSLGKSQNDLATSLSYTNQAISSFENAKTSPSISILPALADFLELSLDDLMAKRVPSTPATKNAPFDEEKIRQNILALRVSKGYSQTEEGELLGVSRRTIIHYEKGTSIPSVVVLEKLLSIYQIRCSSFFYDDLEAALGFPKKRRRQSAKKTGLYFFLGFLLGGGLLSAILLPFAAKASSTPSTSSAPYQYNSTSSSDSSKTSSSTAIPGLEKFVVITTNGQARSASLYVGQSLTLTLYAEPSFDFTELSKTAYTLRWSLSAPGVDLSGIHLSEASPYPCETLSADASFTPGAVIDVQATLQSINHPERVAQSESLSVTVYK
jgi:transcriptional regulator with XRE-family HTH domain